MNLLWTGKDGEPSKNHDHERLARMSNIKIKRLLSLDPGSFSRAEALNPPILHPTSPLSKNCKVPESSQKEVNFLDIITASSLLSIRKALIISQKTSELEVGSRKYCWKFSPELDYY